MLWLGGKLNERIDQMMQTLFGCDPRQIAEPKFIGRLCDAGTARKGREVDRKRHDQQLVRWHGEHLPHLVRVKLTVDDEVIDVRHQSSTQVNRLLAKRIRQMIQEDIVSLQDDHNPGVRQAPADFR